MKQNLANQIHSRYQQVRGEIDNVCNSIGKSPDSIQIVVVTKTQPIEVILAALEVGIKELGENYVEEAEEKIQVLGDLKGITWHMIGHVQSRKAEQVAHFFDYVHSVDSFKLAQRLDRFAVEENRILQIFIECNLSGEESKFGYSVVADSQMDFFFNEVKRLTELKHLKINGLMTMPPFINDSEKSRPYFRKLRVLSDLLAVHFPKENWNDLSMGTSIDYPIAIKEGATIIRIGTAIFGLRSTSE